MPLHTTDILDIDDVTPAELDALIDRAAVLKAGGIDPQLRDRTLGMIFEKPSTRTRVSFETGMSRLGGHAMFLGPDDIQLGHGEPLRDTARVLGRYVDAVMARLFDHADAEVLAEHADCPVINGLTDEAHPCQTLADLLTIRESVGSDATVAWVGDGNNVGQSFVVGAAMAGIDVSVATPADYGMDPAVFDRAAAFGADIEPTTDPDEIRRCLREQLLSPVQWAPTLRRMQEDGAARFVEVGTGQVLQGLVGRTLDEEAEAIGAGTPEEIARLTEA